MNGIDISNWQAGIDLSKVPADFVIRIKRRRRDSGHDDMAMHMALTGRKEHTWWPHG